MSRKIDEEMIHFEKRAVNGHGLFLVLLFAIIFFGIGGFLLYKNRDKFDWTLPWEKEEEYVVLGAKPGETVITTSSNRELIVPLLRNDVYKINGSQIKAYGLTGDDKGYAFKLDFTAEKFTTTLIIEKILLDGHDTTVKLQITDNVDAEKSPTTTTIRIPKTEIDAIGLTCFKKMTIYYRLETNSEIGSLSKLDISAYSEIETDNTIPGLIEFYEGDNLKTRYYRTITDKDYTYIYFDFMNQNKASIRNIKIKKLLINDKVYDSSEWSEEIFAGAEKVFYIAIPRSEIKDVKKFNISFYILKYDEKTGDLLSAYVTNEYEKEF